MIHWFFQIFKCKSLDKLASYHDKDKLKIVRSEFYKLRTKDFDLLTRKDVFPYEYIDCVEKLQDMRLSLHELLSNSLTGDTVSENDYAHAMKIWQRFSIRTFSEYSDLYLKTGILLLADIFENFRNSCVARSRTLLYIARFHMGHLVERRQWSRIFTAAVSLRKIWSKCINSRWSSTSRFTWVCAYSTSQILYKFHHEYTDVSR